MEVSSVIDCPLLRDWREVRRSLQKGTIDLRNHDIGPRNCPEHLISWLFSVVVTPNMVFDSARSRRSNVGVIALEQIRQQGSGRF